MRFTVLAVGQGSGNFIEVFADSPNDPPSVAMLIDLGTSQERENLGVPSALYVVQQLRKMIRRDSSGKIVQPAVLEAVVLSHPDKDHVNLIDVLTSKFSPSELVVKKVWFGGDRGGYIKSLQGGGEIDYLALLYQYGPTGTNNLLPPGVFATTMADPDPKKWQPLAEAGGVRLDLLIGNTLYKADKVDLTLTREKKPDGYKTNSSSLVVVVSYKTQGIVVMGDATGLTMAQANKVLGGRVMPCFSLTLPHHGSKRSTWDLKGVGRGKRKLGEKTPAQATVIAFVNSFRPATISASAWEFSTFRHPSMEVVNAFGTCLNWNGITPWTDPVLTGSQHFFTAYSTANSLSQQGGLTARYPSKAGWYSFRTERPVFTNDYFKRSQSTFLLATPPGILVFDVGFDLFLNPPARAIAWGFEIADAGKDVVKVLDRQDIAQLHPAHAKALLAGQSLPEGDRFIALRHPDEAVEPLPPPPVRRVVVGRKPAVPAPSHVPRRVRQIS
jgi:hypothetical protein